jgi:DNA-directed RNA polymerase subunit RPC12/RpoP
MSIIKNKVKGGIKMTVTEKVAYLKGLAKGLDIDEATKEGKLFAAIVDTLDEMSKTVDGIDAGLDELFEQVEAIDDDLGILEDIVYEEDDNEDDDYVEFECPNCGEIIELDEEDMLADGIICPECGENVELDFDDCDCECGCDCGDKEEK